MRGSLVENWGGRVELRGVSYYGLEEWEESLRPPSRCSSDSDAKGV